MADYLRVALKPPTIWTTIGHGGGGRVRGAMLKAAGVQAGWPDILVMVPGSPGQSLVVGIELKSAKGSLSAEQRDMRVAFKRAGANYAVCRSVDEVEDALRLGSVIVHASVTARAA